EQVTLLSPPPLAIGFVNALAEGHDPQIAHDLLAHWSQLSPAVRRVAIGTLMRRTEWVTALLDGVEKGKIERTDLAPEHWSQLKLNPSREIAERAAKLSAGGGAISADREGVVKELLPLAKEKGDVARGKEVFAATCANCHTFS